MRLSILSDDEIEAVLQATFRVLGGTGIKVYSERALKMLKDAGADVDWRSRQVKIPSNLIEESMRAAPKCVQLYGRDPRHCLNLGGDNLYTVLGSTVPYVIDPEGFERVSGKKEYVAKAARVADALPNLHVAAQFCLALDCPTDIQDLQEIEAVLTNTAKPVMAIAYSPQGARKIIEMAEAIRGGGDRLRKEPLLFMYSEPTSPLEYGEKAADILIEAARSGVPALCGPCVQAGATGPVTLCGTLVQSMAETLTGLIISQLAERGAPFIMGVISTVMDMRTAVMSYGAPEFSLINAAASQLAHRYGIPFFGTGGCSDSKLPDEQAIAEATTSLLMAMLTGTDLIHDIGYIEGGNAGSLEMVVMLDEIFSMLSRIVKGVRVDEGALALDVINEVGSGGHYLSHGHSRRFIAEEHWFPSLIDRKRYARWKSEGGKGLLKRARERLERILSEHEPEPLPDDVLKDIKSISEIK